MKRLALVLLLCLGSPRALVAAAGPGQQAAVAQHAGAVTVELAVPAEFFLLQPDLPQGAVSDLHLFLVELDPEPGAPCCPQALGCTRVEGNGALQQFVTAPLVLQPGPYELFLAEAGYALRFEAGGSDQHIVMDVPEPVAVRLVPAVQPNAAGDPPTRLFWRVSLDEPDPERTAPRPMCEAWPAADGVGFVALACGGRLGLATSDCSMELEPPTAPLVTGPVELEFAWSVVPPDEQP